MATMMSAQQLLQYSMAAPTAEDCLASNEYTYGAPPQQQSLVTIKSEFPSEQFAIAPTYMMMSMGRSFSDGQLSDIYGATLPTGDNVYAAQQQSYQQRHHHYHSYSMGSFPTISDDSSSMSPRTHPLHPSSAGSSAYPMVRTLSEPALVPLFEQAEMSSSSVTDLIKTENESNASSASSTSSPSSMIIRPTPKRSRGRRVSNLPDATSGCKVFTCPFADCGKIFKRSEHLKRHVRSIHTMEKPFPCPIHNCPKRFSRSDNLNQHIRIHRHNNGLRGSSAAASVSSSVADKNSMGNNCSDDTSKSMAAFSPFFQSFASAELMSLS
ncbi:hypothetical protein BGX31_005086 [Mortierella sp. GBA43]|nr:hypothetical protein BGX31_005086 [Mortierella sp. GBA43]